MLHASQIEEFERNGFLKGEVMLDDSEVEQLRAELDLVMEGKSVKQPVLNRNMKEGESPMTG